MEAPQQAAEELQAPPVLPPADAEVVPAPLPPRLHFDPISGVLRVFYPGQDPEPDYSQQQNWTFDGGNVNYQTPAYAQMGMPNLYYTAEAVATNSCSVCRRQFADGDAVLHHLRDHKAHRDTPEACEAAYILQCQEEGCMGGAYGYYSAVDASNSWAGYGGPYVQAAGWQPGFNMTSPSATYPPSMDVYTGEGDMTALAAPPSDAYSGSDSSSDAMQQQQQLQQNIINQYEQAKGRRRRGAAGRGKPMQARQELPKPEEYEAAFPPLGNGAVPTSPTTPPKWGKPVSTAQQTSAKLRVDAQEYSPSTPTAVPAIVPMEVVEVQSTDSQSATPITPPSSKALRVDAPAWTPIAA